MDYKAIMAKHGCVSQFQDVGLCNLILVNDQGNMIAFACDSDEKIAWRALFNEHYSNLLCECLKISDGK